MRLHAMVLVSALIANLSSSAYAIDETHYHQVFQQIVKPTVEANSQVNWFNGKDGVRIHYITIQPLSKSAAQSVALVILPGRTEPAHKYFEVAYDLRDLGLATYIMDHRGQGDSDRLLDDAGKGYVKNFGDYVDDVKTLVDTVIRPAGHDTIFFLTHSMGATIATIYAERYPNDLAGMVLSSPMVELNTSPYPEIAAYAATTFNVTIGKGRDYAPGKGPYEFANETFEDVNWTNCRVRWEREHQEHLDHPERIIGGATNKWVKEAIEGTWEARGRAWELKLPILMFQAGQDAFVKPGGQNWVCDRARDCQKIVFPEAFHEILMERDVIRTPALEAVSDFIQQHLQ